MNEILKITLQVGNRVSLHEELINNKDDIFYYQNDLMKVRELCSFYRSKSKAVKYEIYCLPDSKEEAISVVHDHVITEMRMIENQANRLLVNTFENQINRREHHERTQKTKN